MFEELTETIAATESVVLLTGLVISCYLQYTFLL